MTQLDKVMFPSLKDSVRNRMSVFIFSNFIAGTLAKACAVGTCSVSNVILHEQGFNWKQAMDAVDAAPEICRERITRRVNKVLRKAVAIEKN